MPSRSIDAHGFGAREVDALDLRGGCKPCDILRERPTLHAFLRIGRVRLKMGEGLTGWVAKERRFVAISRESYQDPRFKKFSDLPEDTYEAFLSAPVIARNKVVGVINVQHRAPHAFSGLEMELLTTVGEQIGCLLLLSRMPASAIQAANHAELALATPVALVPPGRS